MNKEQLSFRGLPILGIGGLLGAACCLWIAYWLISQDQRPHVLVVVAFDLACGVVVGTNGLYILFGTGKDVWFNGEREIVVRGWLSKQRVPIEQVERIESYRSILFGDEHVGVWRLAVAGRRRGVYLDERAKGFPGFRAGMSRHSVPIVAGRHSRFRRYLLLLRAAEPSHAQRDDLGDGSGDCRVP